MCVADKFTSEKQHHQTWKNEIHSPAPVKIDGQIDKKDYTFAIRSASAISTLDISCIGDRKLLPIESLPLRSNDSLNILGAVPLTFQLSGKEYTHTFAVLDTFTQEAVLGADFLTQNKATLQYHKDSITLALRSEHGPEPENCHYISTIIDASATKMNFRTTNKKARRRRRRRTRRRRAKKRNTQKNWISENNQEHQFICFNQPDAATASSDPAVTTQSDRIQKNVHTTATQISVPCEERHAPIMQSAQTPREMTKCSTNVLSTENAHCSQSSESSDYVTVFGSCALQTKFDDPADSNELRKYEIIGTVVNSNVKKSDQSRNITRSQPNFSGYPRKKCTNESNAKHIPSPKRIANFLSNQCNFIKDNYIFKHFNY